MYFIDMKDIPSCLVLVIMASNLATPEVEGKVEGCAEG